MRKPRVAFELAIALIICLLTQGCVGVFVNKTKTELVQNPGVGATATAGEVFKAKATDQIRSAAWVKKHWGDPASITALQSEDHTELWTYRLRPVWCGVVVGAIVPIPLVLPMASESVTFSVQEGEIIKAKVVKEHWSGVGFGPSPEGGFVSIARW